MTTPNGSAFYTAVAEFCARYGVLPVSARPYLCVDTVQGSIQVEWGDFDRLPLTAVIEQRTAVHNPGTSTTHRTTTIDGFCISTCETVRA